MELLKRDQFFSILSRIGFTCRSKVLFFQTNEIIGFGGFFNIYIYLEESNS
jgi:hypothetical protein